MHLKAVIINQQMCAEYNVNNVEIIADWKVPKRSLQMTGRCSHHYYRMTPFRPEIEEAEDTVSRYDCPQHHRRFDQYCFVLPGMLPFQLAVCTVQGVHAWQHNVKVCYQRYLGSSPRHLNTTAMLSYSSLFQFIKKV